MPNLEEVENAANTARTEGRMEEAVELYQQLAQLKPGDVAVLNALGICHLTLYQSLEAAGTFERAIAIQPTNAVLYRHLALAYQGMGRDMDAAQNFQKAISLAPQTANSYGDLGQILALHGNRVSAVEYLRTAYELEPNTVWGNMQLARAYIEDEKFEEAVGVLQKLSENPESGEAPGLLGFVLQQLGRFEEAEVWLKKALSLQPWRLASYFNVAYGKRVSNADRDMINAIRALLDNEQVPPEGRRLLHYALGKAADDMADYGKAMRNFDDANQLALAEKLRTRGPFNRERLTAKFDAIIKEFTPEYFEAHQAEGSSSEVPIFIVGMMRSGTTLVEQILSSHKEIGSAGEVLYWLPKGENILEKEPAAALADEYLELLQSYAPGMPRVTDKMPHNYQMLGPIHTVLPKARIIHCMREPIDNCLSIYVTPYRTSPDFAHDRESIVFAYREYQRLMAHWRSVLPAECFFEVKYEDLVNDREKLSREMIAFCGLEWDEACMKPEVNGRSVRTPSLWQARQPVYTTSLERWRRYEPWLGAFKKLLPS
jgi:Flp pilus assembly protein TadD